MPFSRLISLEAFVWSLQRRHGTSERLYIIPMVHQIPPKTRLVRGQTEVPVQHTSDMQGHRKSHAVFIKCRRLNRCNPWTLPRSGVTVTRGALWQRKPNTFCFLYLGFLWQNLVVHKATVKHLNILFFFYGIIKWDNLPKSLAVFHVPPWQEYKAVFKPPGSKDNSLRHSYIQPLKYYLVPHEEKWYAHLRSDVIKLQIISITKPHRQSHLSASYMLFPPSLSKVSPS